MRLVISELLQIPVYWLCLGVLGVLCLDHFQYLDLKGLEGNNHYLDRSVVANLLYDYLSCAGAWSVTR